jgi:hypothetical protein
MLVMCAPSLRAYQGTKAHLRPLIRMIGTSVSVAPMVRLTTYVDATTRLESIAGTVKVVTLEGFAEKACEVQASKPSDKQDLEAVVVSCEPP